MYKVTERDKKISQENPILTLDNTVMYSNAFPSQTRKEGRKDYRTLRKR